VEKMQFIFFVPPNEELEGTLHPQKFGCTPKNEGKRVHVPPDEKTCGHTAALECGTLQTCYLLWSAIRLSVLWSVAVGSMFGESATLHSTESLITDHSR
jgi:hypothetical protein